MGFLGGPPVHGVGPDYAPPSGEQETRALKAQAEHLEVALSEIRKRLAELEAVQKKEE